MFWTRELTKRPALTAAAQAAAMAVPLGILLAIIPLLPGLKRAGVLVNLPARRFR